MTAPRVIVTWDGTSTSLLPLGRFSCYAQSNKDGPWKLLCPGGTGEPALVGDLVTLDDDGRLRRVEKDQAA